MNNSYSVFTDGASKGNPGPGGYGAIVFSSDSVFEIGGRETQTTNNRMELSAVLFALKSIPEGSDVVVYSDSRYVINGITSWVYGWEKNGWITKEKKEVLNKDLWEELVSVTRKRTVRFEYVAGHQGTPANERVDTIASSFAEGEEVVLYNGKRNEYGITPEIPKGGGEKKKSGTVYGYVSYVDGKGEVHKTWAECKARVEGKSKPKYKKVYSQTEATEVLKKWKSN
ncbi:MAG: ribonuclease HI [Candidatus Paceibacterota bacterium]